MPTTTVQQRKNSAKTTILEAFDRCIIRPAKEQEGQEFAGFLTACFISLRKGGFLSSPSTTTGAIREGGNREFGGNNHEKQDT